MLQLILYSILAGVVGTSLGAVIAILIKHQSKTLMFNLLNFASGMMISITCFKLIPESIELSNIFFTAAGVIIGVLVILFLNKLINNFEEKKLLNNSKYKTKNSILKSGFIMLIAIGLHNLPEGLAIGSTGAYNQKIGFVIAFTIALHNIPEGMAIAVPLKIGGLSKTKTLIYTALAGFTTVIGAVIGYLVGVSSAFVSSFALAIAGGAMLYVTFGEMIPQSFHKSKNSIYYLLFGFILAMIIMFVT